MHVTITLYGPSGDVVGKKTVERDVAPGTTVREAFAALLEEYPDLEGYLLTADGERPRGSNVTIDGASIDREDGLDTELEDGDQLRVAPALEGG